MIKHVEVSMLLEIYSKLLTEKQSDVLPIEVKARENVKSRSLSVYVKHYHPDYSIRISGKNFGFENGILAIPVYAVFCL